MVFSQWETRGTEFFPTHPQSQLPAPASAISNPETRTCVEALLQPLLPSRTSHSSETALSGLFIGACTAPEGQDGGVNNLFSPFPHPSRACSPPPPLPLFAQMNVPGLAQSLALHLNGAVSSQDGFSWGFYGCCGDWRMLWFSFPLPLQDFKEGAVWGLLLSLEICRVSSVTSTVLTRVCKPRADKEKGKEGREEGGKQNGKSRCNTGIEAYGLNSPPFMKTLGTAAVKHLDPGSL